MKKSLCIALALVLCLGLLACQSSGGDGPLYGLILQPEGSAYQDRIRVGFEMGVEALGGRVVTCYPTDDSAQAQIDLVEYLMEQGVQGIAISGNDAEGLEDVLKKARKAGISVVSLDRDTEGSQLFINQASFDLVAQSLLDAVYALSGGEGEFAVLSTNHFSGMDVFVHSLEVLHKRNEKYRNLIWMETRYCDGSLAEEKAQELLDTYADLKVICSVSAEGLVGVCRALESSGSKVKATGISNPSAMKDLVGDDKPCPYFFLWNPMELGNCAAYALEALCAGAALEKNGTLTTALEAYMIYEGYFAQFQIYVGPPYKFDGENIAQWADVY